MSLLLFLLLFYHEGVRPLVQAHAHNDYLHKRPLHDALEQGFCSVEADIFLTADNSLQVGHSQKELSPERTLEVLYLKPLRDRIRKNNGRVYPGHSNAFYLFIDIKTDGARTYPVLHQLLTSYSDVLTEVRDGKVSTKPVTIVISGSRPSLDLLARQSPRFAAYDGRLKDLDSDHPSHLIPVISDNWVTQLGWGGQGTMPELQREKLKQIVAKSHARQRKVRFWATPEKESLWKLLLQEQVDLINTDRLVELQQFLSKHPH